MMAEKKRSQSDIFSYFKKQMKMSTDNVDIIEKTQINTSTSNTDSDVVKPQQVNKYNILFLICYNVSKDVFF